VEQNYSKKQNNKETGALGEQIVAEYYQKRGFTVLERNHLRKWGEIDVIAEKAHKIHFIEVKTVSHETKADLEAKVARANWRPEENVHRHKLQKLGRVIGTWLKEHNCLKSFQIDVVTVRIVPHETFSTINVIENVILD